MRVARGKESSGGKLRGERGRGRGGGDGRVGGGEGVAGLQEGEVKGAVGGPLSKQTSLNGGGGQHARVPGKRG